MLTDLIFAYPAMTFGVVAAASIIGALHYLTRQGHPKAPFVFGPSSHVIITGGSSGVGLATAKALAAKGCSVTIIARDKVKLDAAKIEISAASRAPSDGAAPLFTALSADVSKSAEIEAAVAKAAGLHGGRIDALVACAGVARPGYLCEIDTARLEQMVAINYLGVMHSVRAVVPSMKERGSGRLILVSSLGGLLGVVGYSGYTPTKYAVRGLANVLQMELLPFGIQTSLVCPPDVDTPQLADENKYKPAETAEIAADAGIFQPEAIADDIVSALSSWRFFVNTGFDGWLLGLISNDLTTPAHSAPRALVEIATAGILRIVAIAYLWSYNRICARHHRDREAGKEATKKRK